MTGFSTDYPPCCHQHRSYHVDGFACPQRYPPVRVLPTPELDDESDAVLERGIVADDVARRESGLS